MSDIAIKVENLSKLYELGSIGTGSLRNDLARWWASINGKEDPFQKIGTVNDRTKKADSDFVWALRDISFEAKKGEVLGILGRNGAGKSTLLKILSKITTPSAGKINVNGRVASLLEVGTGFHPDLTGRENIFMNGAILGMRKWEIQKKFDEIVEFAGVNSYIDTPVKRYSSGMYVRLAFAVAAFLEPEILIVDEVLAVGDDEFQRKCLGRMKDVSFNDGRTVLFVSHNMIAINTLCDNAILMDNGVISGKGNTNSVINSYINKNYSAFVGKLSPNIDLDNISVRNISFNESNANQIEIFQGEKISFGFNIVRKTIKNVKLIFNIEIKTANGIPVGCFGNEFQTCDIIIDQDNLKVEVDLDACAWKEDLYFVSLYYYCEVSGYAEKKYLEDIIQIKVKGAVLKNDNWRQYIFGNSHGFVPIKWSKISLIR